MIHIHREFRVGGVLTDMTSVKLSDPTGAYGLKRDDTGAVLVPDGADFTHTGTGTYDYLYDEVADPAAGRGLIFTYSIEHVYEGDTRWESLTIAGAPVSIARAAPAAAVRQMAYQASRGRAEALVYRTAAGATRNLYGLVERMPEQGPRKGEATVKITVVNWPTVGIATEELRKTDTIDVADNLGGTPRSRMIPDPFSQDEEFLTLELR